MYINWINYGYTGNSGRSYSDVINTVNGYLDEINYATAPYEGIARAFVNAELVTKNGANYVFTGRRTPPRDRDLSLLPELVARLADDMEQTYQEPSLMAELLSGFSPTEEARRGRLNLNPDKLRIVKIFLERIA
ncbi:hypothetical protein CL642_01210 [bacterium]|jgi:hypothetical protein|nr:hypothetical protein [bacterium]|tara:strand:- start:11382 stop:11783 length:402 start_codon:yes stop_codon:yes gene_type:complete